MLIAVLLSAGCAAGDERAATSETAPAGAVDAGGAAASSSDHGLPLDSIHLPPGFSISVFSAEVPGARSMTLSPSGVLYVGTREGRGPVYALTDVDGDGRAERVRTIDDGLDMPNGVALRDGALYVAEVSRILRYDEIDQRLDDPPEPVVVNDGYPSDQHHGWKFIAFGPDGWLYVPVGAPCNVCDPDDEIYATLTRIRPDGSEPADLRPRHPQHRRLRLGPADRRPVVHRQRARPARRRPAAGRAEPGAAQRPALRLPVLPRRRHCRIRSSAECTSAASTCRRRAKLGPHVAALGMRFYTGDMFPAEYRGQIFIAEHGSWNRSSKIGYRVMLARLEGGEVDRGRAVRRGLAAGASARGGVRSTSR